MSDALPSFDLARARAQRARERGRALEMLEDDPDRSAHVSIGWWEPHRVYHLRWDSYDLAKIGFSRVGARRLSEMIASGAIIEQELIVANKWVAVVVESAALDLTDSHRAAAAPALVSLRGGTEFRSADLGAFSLRDTMLSIGELSAARHLHTTVKRGEWIPLSGSPGGPFGL